MLIKKLTDILKVNFDKEGFGVKKLAKKAGLSRSKLHRKLYAIKGKSTSEFIREYKLEKALIMLQNNVATASEISYRVGFSSPQYFSKCFQDYYGYAPGEAKHKTQSLIEDNKETKKKELIGGFQNLIATQKNRKSLFSKRIIWISSLAIVLISVFGYYLFSNYYFTSKPHSKDINERSIAIIPFKNLSDNIENQYFADGMVDDILNHLSGIQGLVVKSRQSSERYRESDKSMMKKGKELGADYLLEGNVQKQEDSIRIIVQLIEAKQDAHIWAKNYDFELKQIFAVQCEISEQIAEELNTVLSPVELEHIEKVPTDNLEAYKMYLNGRFFWHQRTEKDLNKSIYYFNKAIELDSTYAMAYAGLADTYVSMGWWEWFDKNDGFNKGKEYALKALSMDSTIAEAHATLGIILCHHERKWKEAEKELLLAISYNPNNATARECYHELLKILGRDTEAREQISLALQLNPYSVVINLVKSASDANNEEYEMAIEGYNKTLELAIGNTIINQIKFNLTLCYLLSGNNEKAVEYIKDLSSTDPTLNSYEFLDKIYQESGIEGVGNWFISWLLANKQNKYVNYMTIAQLYSCLGYHQNALKYLEDAYKNDYIELAFLIRNSDFNAIKTEPRYIALLNKMGLANQ